MCRHGVLQLFSPWADGPEYITQCTIRPRSKYTYKFNVTQQEGTVWWHAHASYLRATVHGAFIIQPRSGQFPFPKPYKQIPLILGISCFFFLKKMGTSISFTRILLILSMKGHSIVLP